MRPVHLALLLGLIVALALPGAAFATVDRDFAARFATNDFGDIATIGNTLMTCPDSEANCAATRNGTGTALDDNNHAMTYVNVAGDALNSSSATLAMPSGAGVLWAGLYWGGDLGNGGSSAFAGAARLTVPGASAAKAITAAQVDTLSTNANRYQAVADVTADVTAAGNGEYTVGGVQAGTGADHYAGWTLVVVYRHGTQERNLRVYDGLKSVSSGPVDIPISGLLTPPTGTVNFRMGLVSYEGDLGLTNDTATLDSTPLTNAANPASNVFNSSIADAAGTRITAKNPDYVNQLGYDSDAFSLNGVLGNDATSATMHLTTSGDVYAPGVITTAIDRANTPPSVFTAPGFSTSTPRDGTAITASPGAWSGTPTITYGYQWQRCNSTGAGCADIAQADQGTYTPTSTDVGKTLRVVVTAHNPIGDTAATSAASGIVAPTLPAVTTAPAISGTARDGSTLTVDDGTWSGTTPMTFTRRWRRCAADGTGCADIAGATGTGYDLVAADVGHTVRVVVTATNPAGSASAGSARSAVITAIPPVSVVAPRVAGDALLGGDLQADTGRWTGTQPLKLAYAWLRCDADGASCAPIDGADTELYHPVDADGGARLRVRVTATNAAGTAVADSDPTAGVPAPEPKRTTAAPPRLVAAPAISGLRRDGELLAATTGTWVSDQPLEYGYQWRRCDAGGANCEDIVGATSPTYRLGSGDAQHQIVVVVTARIASGEGETSAAIGELDLSDLPGSRVAPAACARVSTAVVARPADAGRLGVFHLKIARDRDRSTSWAPARALITGPIARLRAIAMSLDGRTLAVRAGAATLPPGLLNAGTEHRVEATLVAPGRRALRIVATLSTARCAAVFTAARRPGRTTRTLMLRVDARTALRTVAYPIPQATARNLMLTSPAARIGFLRIVRAGGKRAAWRLRGPVAGALLRSPSAPRVALEGSRLTVTGLPAQTGIVTVSLVRPVVAGARTPSLELTGEANTAAGWRRMTFALPAGRRS